MKNRILGSEEQNAVMWALYARYRHNDGSYLGVMNAEKDSS